MILNNNVFPGEGFADPHAIVENGRVYIFAGHDKSPKTEDTWRMDKWQIISSDDLVHWRKEGEILSEDTYIGGKDNCWAGYIQKKDDKFYWFFSNKFYDTGVVVSDNITGPFVDVLKRPVIPEGVAPTSSYDPCVYEEDGVYTIFFGAGKYYCATLSDDMMSLASEPVPITVYDDDGNECYTDDKSTVFKRGDIYYLAYGNTYCMSDKLTGPYKKMGSFTPGGHNDVFHFKGKDYVCHEFSDTSMFFRGIRVVELEFNEDGTVVPQQAFETYPGKIKKEWNFAERHMHWFMSDYNDCDYKDGAIHYDVSYDLSLRTPVWTGFNFMQDIEYKMIIEMENPDDCDLSVKFITVKDPKQCWFTELRDCNVDICNPKKVGENLYEVYPSVCKEGNLLLRHIEICAKDKEQQGKIKFKKIQLSLV